MTYLVVQKVESKLNNCKSDMIATFKRYQFSGRAPHYVLTHPLSIKLAKFLQGPGPDVHLLEGERFVHWAVEDIRGSLVEDDALAKHVPLHHSHLLREGIKGTGRWYVKGLEGGVSRNGKVGCQRTEGG